jgi:leucyl-tRNA synthetase
MIYTTNLLQIRMAKLQQLLKIENEVHSMLSHESVVDVHKKKFFGTFPFPYMNGRLHLGHLYTLMSLETQCRYKHSSGYNVLMPFGFHATGIPIMACANKLDTEDPLDSKSQWNIIKSMGIPDAEIMKFVDPYHWVEYFPAIAKEIDLPMLGSMIDFRRCFVTTDINVYFDSFVKWQFNRLHSLGLLEYGKKHMIYSIKDNQPCQDHERKGGYEGIKPAQYTVGVLAYSMINYYITIVDGEYFDDIRYNPAMGFELWEDKDHYVNLHCMTEYVKLNMQYQQLIPQVEISSHQIPKQLFASLGVTTCKWNHATGIYVHVDHPISAQIAIALDELVHLDYFEPETEVISRSEDKCIVALTDQWYIRYDDAIWRNKVRCYVANTMKFANEVIRQNILDSVDNSFPWPFSRTFGLGTKLPIDPKWLIDSLSDSTVYMAFYTIAHLIGGIDSAVLCDAFWDAVFRGSEFPSHHELIKSMRSEFTYWYPMDLRVSGKDLITNHLTMALFNHEAIFGIDLMPVSYTANGHIWVDGKKMSKSEGNFIIINDAINTYGISATRFTLCDAGSALDDGNFTVVNANSAILNLHCEMMNIMDSVLVGTPELTLKDKLILVHLTKLNEQVHKAYHTMMTRDVIKYGFYELQSLRNKCTNAAIMKLLIHFELIAMYPIVPHWSTYIGNKLGLILEWDQLVIPIIEDYRKLLWQQEFASLILKKVNQSYLKVIRKRKVSSCKITWGVDIADKINSIMIYVNRDKSDIVSSLKALNINVADMMQMIVYIQEQISIHGYDVIAWLNEPYLFMPAYLQSELNLNFEIDYATQHVESKSIDFVIPSIQFI